MDDKRFAQCEIEYGFANTTNIKKIDGIYDMQEEKTYRIEQIVDKLNEQQDTINKLQELVAELGATLLMNGFEIEIDGKDLNELIKDE